MTQTHLHGFTAKQIHVQFVTWNIYPCSLYLLLFQKLRTNTILQVLEVRESFLCELWFICAFICAECLRKHFVSCGVFESRPVTKDILTNEVCVDIFTIPYINAWPHFEGGGGIWRPAHRKFVVSTKNFCVSFCSCVNVWPPVKLQVINLCYSALLASVHQRCSVRGRPNVSLFLTVLLRFIQEIEMNMGPGQAKQCQLRAFLTYYINDLFLNQVCTLQSCQEGTPVLSIYHTTEMKIGVETEFVVTFRCGMKSTRILRQWAR